MKVLVLKCINIQANVKKDDLVPRVQTNVHKVRNNIPQIFSKTTDRIAGDAPRCCCARVFPFLIFVMTILPRYLIRAIVPG